MILFLLIFPYAEVSASTNVVTNTFQNGQIVQYIFVNCDDEFCLDILENINLPIYSDPIDDEEIVPPIDETSDQTETDDSAESTEDSTDSTIDSESDESVEVEDVIAINYHDIRINEVMHSPETGEKEWIELYNTLESSLDLTGFKLIEGSGQKTNLSGTIGAKEYLVFEKSSLNNSGDEIILQNEAGVVIDKLVYGDWTGATIEAGEKGNSIILWLDQYQVTESVSRGQENVFLMSEDEVVEVDDEIDEVNSGVLGENENGEENELNKQAESETLKQVQSDTLDGETAEDDQQKMVSYEFSEEIRINEVLANPAGSDNNEWIELYYFGTTELDLFGWSIDDDVGGSVPYVFTESYLVQPESYILLKREQTNLALNNSNDRVVIIDPNGVEIDVFNYEKATEAKSWSYFADGWQETSILTPEEENEREDVQIAGLTEEESIAPSDVYFKPVDLHQLKNESLKQQVLIEDQVLVLPDVFGKNIIYLNGVQVYFSSADWPVLSVGDIVEISGTISESRNERRVLLKNKTDLMIMSHQAEIDPQIITSAQINEELEGFFVQVEGEFVGKESSKMILFDSEGEIVVYLKQGTDIKASDFVEGQRLKINGILSQYDDEYRIQPRSVTDFEIIEVPTEESDQSGVVVTASADAGGSGHRTTVYILVGFFVVLILINLYFVLANKTDLLVRLFQKSEVEKSLG